MDFEYRLHIVFENKYDFRYFLTHGLLIPQKYWNL